MPGFSTRTFKTTNSHGRADFVAEETVVSFGSTVVAVSQASCDRIAEELHSKAVTRHVRPAQKKPLHAN